MGDLSNAIIWQALGLPQQGTRAAATWDRLPGQGRARGDMQPILKPLLSCDHPTTTPYSVFRNSLFGCPRDRRQLFALLHFCPSEAGSSRFLPIPSLAVLLSRELSVLYTASHKPRSPLRKRRHGVIFFQTIARRENRMKMLLERIESQVGLEGVWAMLVPGTPDFCIPSNC